ncbi:type II toxin-antitoxin system VapC family toxin [Methanobrevibacter sp. UBA212]|uniref:type II toxin-antitoxin system VapC family toxin n=1 Tax=Methanobrevibacter sp. UBA212 TaxID=1915476 RepID=UPI0025F513B9|nr:type II toxin-antitoxin system VapC family toxin [Methanobrevibacter sp. UBA212]
MIFVDASYIIALIIEKDQWHEDAIKLLGRLKSEEKIITEAMIIESINLIGSCHGGKVGYMTFKYIKDNFTIFKSETLLEESLRYYLKFDGTLSLADCTAIHAMKENQIYEILSFDDDFDKVDGILRLH